MISHRKEVIIMGQLTTEELLQMRRRTSTDIWLNDVEDILSTPGLKDKYISRLHDIDVELARRGISVT